jgi:tRNA(fMet)-specific endonuclease VapC
MYLLDTNYCSRIIFGDSAVIARVRTLDSTLLSTSVIVTGELVFMAWKSAQRTDNLQSIESFLQDIFIRPVDREVADIYEQLKSSLFDRFGPREKGARRRATLESIGFTENDLWIASTSIKFYLTLVSSDSDFQRMQEAWNFPMEIW